MKMSKIADNFCGYLNIGNDTFTCNVSNHVVTLLPALSEHSKRYEVINRIRSRDTESPEYLYGVADDNYEIAILRNSGFVGNSLGHKPSIQFATPIIIKACGNVTGFYSQLTAEWNNFHAITFYGGNINAVCNPQMAVAQPNLDYIKMGWDGASEIKILPWDDYTRSIDLEIYGEKAKLTISVMQTGGSNDAENMGSYSLGSLSSFIRFSFDNAQSFEKIKEYYRIMKSLVSVLTMRNNIYFEVYLSQRNSNDQFYKTGVCKIFDHYENYSTRKWHDVIHIYNILDCVPMLIAKITNDEVGPLLALLPEDNKRAKQISITNVQDLCTALEVAYGWSKRSKERDPLIAELKKQIKKTITEFTKTHDEIDIYKETTITSSFQYLDYTLKQKILTLYKENCNAVSAIILKFSLPQLNEANIGSFVKLRNSKTHSGTIEWGDSAYLYTALLALEYACLFRYIGLSNEEIRTALLQIL